MTLPTKVKIVEVGPRDGLQNEKSLLAASDKIELINQLSETGLSHIEAGSFVSPKWVPQMANSGEVLTQINRKDGVCYSALTPNIQGLDAALEARVDEIAIFGAASESFSKKNINCSINESIERFSAVAERAQQEKTPMRGYISCIAVCPYEGAISPSSVANVALRMVEMGCHELSLGDTVGAATPTQIIAVLDAVTDVVPVEKLAIHCHDTYGQALANIYAALQYGVNVVDSSIAGLGGCPYAKGASGNVATEDVIYMLNGLGISTGVNLPALVDIGNRISRRLNRTNQSRTGVAMLV